MFHVWSRSLWRPVYVSYIWLTFQLHVLYISTPIRAVLMRRRRICLRFYRLSQSRSINPKCECVRAYVCVISWWRVRVAGRQQMHISVLEQPLVPAASDPSRLRNSWDENYGSLFRPWLLEIPAFNSINPVLSLYEHLNICFMCIKTSCLYLLHFSMVMYELIV